jgi:DhnA family fructose-bisphosphate aldolase class Ia
LRRGSQAPRLSRGRLVLSARLVLEQGGETALDVIGYGVQIAAQLGAHVIKVKLPTAHLEQDAARKVYEDLHIPIDTQAERVRHIVDCAFAGRRIVIFSGGAAEFDDDKLLEEIRSIHAGGGFGSILGRNSFQLPRAEALRMLGAVMDVYASDLPGPAVGRPVEVPRGETLLESATTGRPRDPREP